MTEPGPPRRSPTALRTTGRVAAFAAFGTGLGGVAGVAWWKLVELPSYLVNTDGGASTSERALTAFFGGDAWFAALGLVIGLLLGVLGWRSFRELGWPAALLVVLVALAAGLVCWLVGYRLGPGEFNPRLVAASPGDFVPIELTLRARASLFTWPFFAVIPVLLASSLGRDEEDPRPQRPRPAGAGL